MGFGYGGFGPGYGYGYGVEDMASAVAEFLP